MAGPEIGCQPMTLPPSEKKQPELQEDPCRAPRSDGVHCLGRKSFPMLKRLIIGPLALVAASLAIAAPAQAQSGWPSIEIPGQRGDGLPSSQWDAPRRERAPEQENEKSLSEILRILKGQYGGQHLDARKQGSYYMISWITDDGRRLNLRVNARTGRVE